MPASAKATPTPPPSNSVHVSKKRRRRALDLVGWIAPLKLAFPEFESIIGGAIQDLEHEANRNPESDRQLILAAVHSGIFGTSDLVDELQMKRKELQTHLDALVLANCLIRTTRKSKYVVGGRPEYLYIPAPNSLMK